MKKILLTISCVTTFLFCGMYSLPNPIIPSNTISRMETGAYWLYIGMDDRVAVNPEDAIGRHKKGDLVSVVPVFKNAPSAKVQGIYAIVKVDSISIQDIVKFTSSWEDTVIAGKDTTIILRAYRQWTFDVDSLSISKGIDTTKISFETIKTKSSKKTAAMLLGYERKCRIERYVHAPIRRFFDWAIPKAYATEQITTCNLPGETYPDIVTWESTEDGAMTTGNPDVLEVYDDDGILKNSTRVDIDGWTNNDATTQIIIRTATGEQHTGTDSTGFQRENTNSGTQSILTRESYTILDGLDINNGAGTSTAAIWIFDGTNHIVRNCLIWNSNVGAISLDSAQDGGALIENNVIYELGGASSQCISLNTVNGGTLYHNTCHDAPGVGIYANYSGGTDSVLAINNASFIAGGASDWDFFGVTLFKVGSTNNCSSDGTANSGALANGVINKTDTDNFIDPSAPARNFKVKDNGADIYNAGDDLSGTVDDDIIGTARPQSTDHDIGAFELIVAAPAAAVERRRLIITND